MIGRKTKSFSLLVLFPRIWQTNALGTSVYALASVFVGLLFCATLLSNSTPSAIPDNVLLLPNSFLLLSGIVTLYWIFKSTSHFRVGVLGYRIASPPLPMVVLVIGMLWCSPVACFFYTSQTLRHLATFEDAGLGYLRLQRFATLLNAGSHFEQLRLQAEIQPLEPRDRWSKPLIREIAQAAIQPAEIFAPAVLKGVLLTLLRQKVPECGEKLQSKSKADTVANIESDNAILLGQSSTAEERESLRAERASRLDQANSSFDQYTQHFRDCLDRAVQDTHVKKEDIDQELKMAQRNAYLVYVAHGAFGPNSGNFRKHTAEPNFAAPELSPFGLGDLTVVAAIIWIVVLIAGFYVSAEYADAAALQFVLRNGILSVSMLMLVVSFFSVLSPIPRIDSSPSFVETVALLLHWPALAVLPLSLLAVVGTILRPSRKWSRFALLAVFVGAPIALIVETLNAAYSLPSLNYGNGNCPRPGWIVTDVVHCAAYSFWQPFYRAAGQLIAGQLNWPNFWLTPAGRSFVSAVFAAVLIFPTASILLFLLKREFARPRDQ